MRTTRRKFVYVGDKFNTDLTIVERVRHAGVNRLGGVRVPVGVKVTQEKFAHSTSRNSCQKSN